MFAKFCLISDASILFLVTSFIFYDHIGIIQSVEYSIFENIIPHTRWLAREIGADIFCSVDIPRIIFTRWRSLR